MRTLFLSMFMGCFFLMNAQEEPGYHEHKGFYLSMGIGPVFGGIDGAIVGQKVYMGGTAGLFDLKIGGAIKKNLILHATLMASVLPGPTVEWSNARGGIKGKLPDQQQVDETMIVGGGVTYYLMPLNFFFSASLGLGKFTLTNTKESTSNSTENGFSMQLKLGKEWWVHKNWGLGIGLTYGKTYLTELTILTREQAQLFGMDRNEEVWNSNRFGIVFNATFN